MTIPTIVKNTSYRILVPTVLIFAALIRPCIISIGYLVLAFVSALLPSIVPDAPVWGSVRLFSFTSLGYTLATTVAQIAYQIYEAVTRTSDSTYTQMCNRSTSLELWRAFGFFRFNQLGDSFDASRTIVPEIISVFISTLNLILVVVLSHQTPIQLNETQASVQTIRDQSRLNRSRASVDSKVAAYAWNAFKRFTNFGIILYAGFIACLQPSLLNFVYFVAFLVICTWWAIYRPALKHTLYNGMKAFLIFYSALHFILIYTFQIHLFQKKILGDSDLTYLDTLTARIVGLTRLVVNECSNWYTFEWTDQPWPAVANPIAILAFYFILVVQYAATKDGSRCYLDEDDGGSSVHDEETRSTVVDDLNGNAIEDDAPEMRNDALRTPSPNAGKQRQRRSIRLLSPSSNNSDNEGEPQPGVPLRKITSQVVDRQKISQIFRTPGQQETLAHSSMIATITFVLYHSYALALVAMMVWALLYHSIFGLILLITTCLLWVFTNTRQVSFIFAPIILAYVEVLLVIQYMCSMNLTPQELGFNGVMKMFGFVLATSMTQAFITLFIKLLLSLPVFLLLRLSRREKFYESLSEHERNRRTQSYGTFTSSGRHRDRLLEEGNVQKKESWAKLLAAYFSKKLATYFIFIVTLVLLLTGTQEYPNLYIIGFFTIWCLEIINLKISFVFFRSVAYLFWLGLILYTSIVIISLYVYQFPGFAQKFQSWTGLSAAWCTDIGLVNYNSIGQSGSLFVKLLLPILLFAVTMLQLKFFHDLWSQFTQPARNGQAQTDQAERQQQAGTSRRDMTFPIIIIHTRICMKFDESERDKLDLTDFEEN
ncbi:hypothetical protein WR25_25656 [Diploscapter pachys]|uniref:Piezo TM1-24 domain-containing protein n=1 Tax=Diploscapter pachys TaxID=2018661 RepID=A0A2A2KLF4_9BILA|nr:hypothetical protein WR25_25656 [Diploscapter pachys]